MLRDVPPHAEPFGPDNALILANGLLTVAPISTATRFTAIARSPLTGDCVELFPAIGGG